MCIIQWLWWHTACCRFLGTTPDSTTVGSLLSSLIRQLMAVKSRSLVQEELPTVGFFIFVSFESFHFHITARVSVLFVYNRLGWRRKTTANQKGILCVIIVCKVFVFSANLEKLCNYEANHLHIEGKSSVFNPFGAFTEKSWHPGSALMLIFLDRLYRGAN